MFKGAITSFASYPAGSTAYGLDVTANASAHVKGAYGELVASTAFAADGFFVQVVRAAGSRKYCVDFAIGAAASEVVIVPDLIAQFGDDVSGGDLLIDVPLAIASGTRLSSRCQCTTGGSAIRVAIYPYATDNLKSTITGVVSYGQNTGITTGLSVDPGGTANTKGAYVEATASTSAAMRGLCFRVAQQQNTFPTFGQWKFDIATGAAGSETVVLGDLVFDTADLADCILPTQWAFGLAIAAGTRLAVRSQSTITDASDRVLDVQLVTFSGSGSSTTGGGSWGSA